MKGGCHHLVRRAAGGVQSGEMQSASFCSAHGQVKCYVVINNAVFVLNGCRMALDISKNEGAMCFYRGLPAAVFRCVNPGGRLFQGMGMGATLSSWQKQSHGRRRHIPYSGTRILVYEKLRERWGSPSPPAAKLAMGLAAGAIGQAVAVPADLIKVRLQVDSRARGPRRYLGLLDAIRRIPREEGGIRGLWRGGLPSIQRAALVNLGECPVLLHRTGGAGFWEHGAHGESCHPLHLALQESSRPTTRPRAPSSVRGLCPTACLRTCSPRCARDSWRASCRHLPTSSRPG